MKAMKLEGSLVGIDPGPRHSAVVVYNPCGEAWPTTIPRHVRIFNAMLKPLIMEIMSGDIEAIGIESIASYGMPVGEEIFTTCIWTGRIVEMFSQWRIPVRLFPRADVKMHLCKTMRAKDANIRQAIIDLYGGREEALGRKSRPGPLYGVSEDEWSALAVALTLEAKLIYEAVAV